MKPFHLATANVAKDLSAPAVNRAVSEVCAAADVVCWQEIERDQHVEALRNRKGWDTFWPTGRPQVVAANATPISWRADRFALVTGGHQKLTRGIAKVTPNRNVVWVVLRDLDSGEKLPVVCFHALSGITKPTRYKPWGYVTRYVQWVREMRAVKTLTNRLAVTYGRVAGGGDLNHRSKLGPNRLGATTVYAAHPTHGAHWYDLLWLRGATAAGTRRVSTPSDHDALVATITTGQQPNPTPRQEPSVLHGIDVSANQPSDVTAHVAYDFAIIKATEGIGYVSHACNAQYAAAKKRGKLLGVYHFGYGHDPAAEADWFVKNVRGYIGEAVLVLDWEAGVVAKGSGWVRSFLRRVHETTGVHPLVYGSESILAAHGIPALARAENSALWVAAYPSMSPTGHRTEPQLLGSVIRQYSSSGHLGGYSGRLDLNCSTLTRDQWHAYAANGKPAPKHAHKPATQEDDMPYTEKQLRQIIGTIPIRHAGIGKDDKAQEIPLEQWAAWVDARTQRIEEKLDEVLKAVQAK